MSTPTLNTLPPPPAGKTGWPWTEAPPPLPAMLPDGRPWPRISIVTPSYNQGQFIEETIRSVLLQGYPNLEYIIIDGGSTDNSVEIIKKYEPWLTYWVSEKDRGQAHAINKGLERCTGEIIGWLNSDDCFFRDALEAVGAFFVKNDKAVLVTGQAIWQDVQGNHLAHHVLRVQKFKDLLKYHHGCYLAQPAVFWRSTIFTEPLRLREDLVYTMDLELWLRIGLRVGITKPISILDRSIAVMKSHATQKTHRGQTEAHREVVRCTMAYARAYGFSSMQILRLYAQLLQFRAFNILTEKFGDASSHHTLWNFIRATVIWARTVPGFLFTPAYVKFAGRCILRLP